ncbi:MAG: response regulator [Chloroflexi bacterium]|nr:response regulator [Chloroflexota bacterium]
MAGDKKEILKTSQLFWKLSDSQLEKIATLCHEESYEAGELIFSAGDDAHNCYIVKEGKVALEIEIRIGSRTRKKVTVDVQTKGQVFGWPAVYSERPVNANAATATENTILCTFNGDQLRLLCDDDHDLCRKVMRGLVMIVADRFERAKQTLAHVLSITSHDLRAPLATVQSCLEVIVGGFVGDINDKQKELLIGSNQRIKDLTSMIDNILDISYIEISELDFTNFPLPQVVESSLGDVEGTANKRGIKLENNVSRELPLVYGISKRLRQVLTNLLSNAIKFTPEGGSVSISSLEKDDFVQIEVNDTGIGIAAEDLPRVFDDFYRGMKVSEAEGAGIGLSIAKKIIDAHGGRIWAESPNHETGQGTKFSFTLPNVRAPAKAKEEEEKAIEGVKILVADDDPIMLNATTVVLQSGGYQVVTARDGEEALASMEQEKPDLLILDLLMPKMDGFEVVKRLNEQWGTSDNRIPILILSAVKEDSSRRRYELETKSTPGIDDYIEKPISPPLLLQRVEKILAKSKSRLR